MNFWDIIKSSFKVIRDNLSSGKGPGAIESLFNRFTQNGLTGAQVAENELSMQNAEDIYQRQVTGMQKAGLNPALMYQSGASGSAPSAPSQSDAGLSMSDLMQVVMMPLQRQMLQSQIENVRANTEKQVAETDTERNRAENLALINLYYPSIQEGTLSKMASEIGVNLSTVDKNDADTALKWIQKEIADKENKFAEAYYKARVDYESAKTDEAKANAARAGADALMTTFEREYAQAHGAKLSSSSVLAIASAIGNLFSQNMPEVTNAVKDSLKPFGLTPFNMPESVDKAINDAYQKGKKGAKHFFRSSKDKFVDFVYKNFNGFGQ